MKGKFYKNINIKINKIKVSLQLFFFKKADIIVNDTDEATIQIFRKWAEIQNIIFWIETRRIYICIKGHHYFEKIDTERHCNILHFIR